MINTSQIDLFPSTLIVSSDKEAINLKIGEICDFLHQKINPNNPDIFILNQDTGWTIELVRQTKNFLSQKPFNHQNKVVIIYDAHNLNSESQNALLKTLEEPGENNYLIITTSKPSKIISTIISRCHLIKLKNSPFSDSKIKPLLITHDLKKDLAQSDSLSKDKTQVLPFLEEQLKIYQQELVNHPSLANSQIIAKIIKSIQMINANVDPRSALDFVFLS
jgi:DNA polymerase III delta prime subunit